MNYNEVKNAFLELKDILIKKKEAIIKKNLEVLNSTDEMAMVILEKINKFDILNNNFEIAYHQISNDNILKNWINNNYNSQKVNSDIINAVKVIRECEVK